MKESYVSHKEGFEDLYETHYGRIFARCLRLLGNRQDAEEVAQEVFLKTWTSRESIDPDQNIAGWLTRVTTNKCIDLIRSRNTKPQTICINDGDQAEGGANMMADTHAFEPPPQDPTANAVMEILQDEAVLAAIRHLPEIYSHAITLRYFEGNTPQEIADRTHTPLGTIKSRLSRGAEMMRKNEEFFPTED